MRDCFTVRRIGEIFDILNGGTPNTNELSYWNGGIDWVTPSDITSQGKKYLCKTQRTISDLGMKNSSATLLPAGTIMLCSRATIGEMAIADHPMCTNQGFKNLIAREGYDNVFLYYALQPLKSEMISKAYGSTFLEISKKALSNISVSLPEDIHEQNAIATALSDVDELISNLEKLIEKKKNIKHGVMQELLTGKRRLPGFEGEWRTDALGNITQYATDTVDKSCFELISYVGTDNMLQNYGGIVPNQNKILSTGLRQYREGDILVSNIRPYLKKIWRADRIGCCSLDVLVLRPHDDKTIFSDYLYSYIAQDAFFDYIMSSVKGTKMPRGDKKEIMKYMVRFPADIEEQKAIAETNQCLTNEIVNLKQKLNKYRVLKQGMMQKLLTGEIRLG